jgi:hypothetical protein
VEDSVEIDLPIGDGQELDLGDGKTLEVIHTPGHSKGSVSLQFHEDGALISGDAVPISGTVPIYEDLLHSIKSVRRLEKIKSLKVLLTSWDEPRYGDRIYALMNEALRYFQQIHEVVLKERKHSNTSDIRQLSKGVLKGLGLPEAALIPIVFRSIEAHLRVADCGNLLQAF